MKKSLLYFISGLNFFLFSHISADEYLRLSSDLGLSLSYDIVKSHGGEIKVDTKEGEGTEFNILLPIV